MDVSRKLVVRTPEVTGLEESIDAIPEGKIPTIAFLHRTSNVDGQIAASVLSRKFNLAVADWSTNHSNPLIKSGLAIAGADQFYPINVTHKSDWFPERRRDEEYTLQSDDFEKLRDAVLTEGKTPLIAAQRRGFDGTLYKNSGLGAPFLAQLTKQHVVLPVFVDIDYDQVRRFLVDYPPRVALNLLTRNRPSSRVIVDAPLLLDPISPEDLELVETAFFLKRKDTLSPLQRKKAEDAYMKLRSQGDEIIMAIGRHLPPARQGIWRERIAEKYPPS